jgi:UDP-glucuronate 4-epimerase
MKKVFVTGCAGFIGSHVVERFLKEGVYVVGMDNFDPFYPKETKQNNMHGFIYSTNFEFIQGDIRNIEDYPLEAFDVVIHLAGKAGVRPSINDPEEYFSVNVTGTQVLHKWMQKHNMKKLVFASSSSIYGNNKQIPFREDHNVDFPISPYAASKKAGELMNHVEHHLNKLDVLNLRFFTVYGPRQRPDLAIHKFVHRICNNEGIDVYGDGTSGRDYTYVSDITSGIWKGANYLFENAGFEIVNLGNSSPILLSSLIEIISNKLQIDPIIVHKPMQPGDVNQTYSDISKAKLLFDYNPKTRFDIGIQSFVKWYNDQGKKLHSQ